MTAGRRALALLVLASLVVACDPATPQTSSPSASASASARATPAPPTGTIAFTRLVPGAEGAPATAGIWTVDAAGGEPQVLIDTEALESFPAWSPDGTRIAWVSGPSFTDGDVWVANADGSEARQLTDLPGRAWRPTWSPDGLRIAFVTDAEGSETWTAVVDEDVPPRSIVPAHWPSWTADGEQLLITVGDSFEVAKLATIDLVEADVTALPIDLPNSSEGTIGPDGSIAFVSSATDYADQDPATWNEDIWLAPPGGEGELIQLTTTPENDHWPPSFSPDGAWIAYTHDAPLPDPTARIALTAPGVPEPIYLTDGSAYDAFPAWKPVP